MKKTYISPEADKIQFNYRDQVVAASTGNEPDDNFMENIEGVGSPVCGSGGMFDALLDLFGSGICN